MATISELKANYDRLHPVTDASRIGWVNVDYAAKLAEANPKPKWKNNSESFRKD